jgi:cytochrome P450
MMTLDPPEASRLKQAMMPPFQRSGTSGRFAEDALPGMCDALLDGLYPQGEADVMEYASAVSAGSLKTVLGLDDRTWQDVWGWCRGLCADIANFEDEPEKAARGQRAKAEIEEAIARKIDALAELGERGEDSALAHMLSRDLTREEIVSNVRLMISGGINEPRDGIGLTTWVLLEDDALRERVRAEPKLWRRLVDEVLRRFTPVGTITRQATRDVTLSGTTIPAGALVAGVLRSADLDERRWTEPTKIDLDRAEGGHAAFALGDHRCLGEWLGRREVALGTARVFDRLPGLRLHPDERVELHGFEFRGPKSLRVCWDV